MPIDESRSASSAGSFDAGAPHHLPQTLDLTQAHGLRDTMIDLLRSGVIRLDAASVERMSTPCMQVLLATGCAAEAAGTAFHIVHASDVFRAAVDDLGLKSKFTNWMI